REPSVGNHWARRWLERRRSGKGRCGWLSGGFARAANPAGGNSSPRDCQSYHTHLADTCEGFASEDSPVLVCELLDLAEQAATYFAVSPGSGILVAIDNNMRAERAQAWNRGVVERDHRRFSSPFHFQGH